ncbi:MAG: hypothetical protein ACLQU1_15430 [Bryobacteraceae bacterium]
MRWTLIFLCASVLLAQGGTDPKPKPEDYEAHGQAKSAAIGAEFMVHSFSGRGMTYLAPDYLVVEVALYPPKGSEIEVHAGAFALRLNGKKTPLTPAGIEMVQASLQHPEWRETPRLEAGAGIGDAGVILGAPRPAQVPGQPPRTGQPLPAPPDADPGVAGVPRTPPVTAAELLVQTALQEGKHHLPASGFLFFPYRGKAGSLKTVELLFEDAAVKLR